MLRGAMPAHADSFCYVQARLGQIDSARRTAVIADGRARGDHGVRTLEKSERGGQVRLIPAANSPQ
jgi:hypothetical protein